MKKARAHRLKFFSLAFGVSVVILSVIFIPIMLELSPLRDYTPSSSPVSSEAAPTYTPSATDSLTTLVIVTEGEKAKYFLLLRLNPVQGQLPVTSLPFNMQIKAGGKTDTLQGHDTYGGTLETKKILESVLDIRIDRTARLSADSFVKALNTLGTVKYTLPYSLIYKNVDANIYINIPKGKQVLDGRAVYDMFRFPSYTEGEAHRYKVQCDVLAKLLNERLNEWLVQHGESVFKTLVNLAETDISYSDFTKELPALRYFATGLTDPAVPVFPGGRYDAQGFSLTQQSADTLKKYFTGDEIASSGTAAASSAAVTSTS